MKTVYVSSAQDYRPGGCEMRFNSTQQNIGWFLERFREGSLKLSPPFQRKPVWAAKQKCYLIESILLNLPVPEIFIEQKIAVDGTSTYTIVDGQQRIRTLLQFIGADTEPSEQQYNKFVLDKLQTTSSWYGKSFFDLTEDQKKLFFGYIFTVRYLNTDSEDDIRDMFRRLNKFLAPLKPQELRNATYTGPFIKLAERLANNEYWSDNRIVTPASIRRMGDIEFVSELIIGVLHGPQGGSSTIIDEYYRRYEDYDEEFPEQLKTEKTFGETLNTLDGLFNNIKEVRWGNKTDFYTLFVALASCLRSRKLSFSKINSLKKALLEFADGVDKRLADEHTSVDSNVIEYVRSVEKGANDKQRRAARHAIVIAIIEPYLKPRPKNA